MRQSQGGEDQNVTFLTGKALVGGCGLGVGQHGLPDRKLMLDRWTHPVTRRREHPEAFSQDGGVAAGGFWVEEQTTRVRCVTAPGSAGWRGKWKTGVSKENFSFRK